jgi:hypothetical protein
MLEAGCGVVRYRRVGLGLRFRRKGVYTFAPDFKSIIDDFVTNMAGASGSTNNVFSLPTEYYQDVGATKHSITYDIKEGTPVAPARSRPVVARPMVAAASA